MKGLSELNNNFNYLRRRSRTTYLTSLISISVVLSILGFFAVFTIFGNAFIQYAQESMYFKAYLHDGIETSRQEAFIEELRSRPYVKEIIFVSKEEAGEIMLKRTGEDVLKLTNGVNPFPASLNLKLDKSYINADSLSAITQRLREEVIIAEIDYPLDMITEVNKKLRLFSLFILFGGLALIGLVLYLIFGTIRLSIYAQRLIIRSMQLIGATNSFIRRPFVTSGLVQGAIAGVIACVLLIASLSMLMRWLQRYDIRNPLAEASSNGLTQLLGIPYIGLLLGIVLFGAFLGFIGSWFAVNRYLNRNLDELM